VSESFTWFEEHFSETSCQLKERNNTSLAYRGKASKRMEEASSYFMAGISPNISIFNKFESNPPAKFIML